MSRNWQLMETRTRLLKLLSQIKIYRDILLIIICVINMSKYSAGKEFWLPFNKSKSPKKHLVVILEALLPHLFSPKRKLSKGKNTLFSRQNCLK